VRYATSDVIMNSSCFICLRRYTVEGTLERDADPEPGCEGVWSFELVGEQTKDDVAFRTGDPC
jgi:hypothetical protein